MVYVRMYRHIYSSPGYSRCAFALIANRRARNSPQSQTSPRTWNARQVAIYFDSRRYLSCYGSWQRLHGGLFWRSPDRGGLRRYYRRNWCGFSLSGCYSGHRSSHGYANRFRPALTARRVNNIFHGSYRGYPYCCHSRRPSMYGYGCRSPLSLGNLHLNTFVSRCCYSCRG